MGSHILVPISDANEVVCIPTQEMPDDPEELLELLASEAAPLTTWVDSAKAYLAAGKEDALTHICLEGIKEEVSAEVERFFGRKPTYEQIQFHCCLAALQMGKARETNDRQRRAEHLGAATKSLNAAALLDPTEQLVALGKGMLANAKNDLNTARHEFTRSLSMKNNGAHNIVGHLALAGLLFNMKHYKEALREYCRALQEHPNAPAEVRLGIAACHLRLGSTTIAGQAYERVLELDPSNADALLGLACIKFNSTNVQQGLADGLQMLVRAYALDPSNVGILVMLAHYCLIKGEHDKVITLGKAAMEATESDAVRAECSLYLARAYHAKGMFPDASMHYSQAARLDPSAPLPHLGTAQMYLSQGNVINASTELETAIRQSPAFFDALKILGQLIGGNPGKAAQVLGHFKGAAAKAQEDAGIWEVLGELSAATDPQGSLKAYRHALSLHRQRVADARAKNDAERAERARQRQESSAAAASANGGSHKSLEASLFASDDEEEEGTAAAAAAAAEGAAEKEEASKAATDPALNVPARLLNNTAVLCYRAGLLTEARALLQESQASSEAVAKATPEQREALQLASGGSQVGEQLSPVHRLAQTYNCARLQESLGEVSEAEAGYKAILKESPGYVDCYLRLACLAHKKGDSVQAIAWGQKALDEAGEDTNRAADAMTLMSRLYLEQKDMHNASGLLRKMLGRGQEGRLPLGTTPDAYARLAYGNLMLSSLPDRKKEEGNRKALELLQRCMQEYSAVLDEQPSNAFAANGVGAVLAELGRLDEAQAVFREVQAAVAASGGYLQIPDLYINMANVALAKQEYASALRLYMIAQEKLGKNSKQGLLLLYLSRAYYDSDDLLQAKQVLLKATHQSPTDYKLWFNLALTMQEWAVRSYRKARPPNDPTKLPEYLKAQSEIKQALAYFNMLVNSVNDKRCKLDMKKLKAHVQFCDELEKRSQAHVEGAQAEANKAEEERVKMHNERKKKEARQALELEKIRCAKENKRKQQEKRAEEAKEKAERLKEEWKQQGIQMGTEGEGAKKKGSKKGGGGKKGARSMANDEEEASEEGGGAELSPYEIAMQAAAAGLDADTLGGGNNTVQEGEDLFGSASDEDYEEPPIDTIEKDLMEEAGLASDQEEGEEPTPGGGGGRLKRARASEQQQERGDGLDDGLEDEDDGAQALFEDEDEDEGATAQPKRQRKALEDSDEEDGGAFLNEDNLGLEEAGQQQEQQQQDVDDGQQGDVEMEGGEGGQ